LVQEEVSVRGHGNLELAAPPFILGDRKIPPCDHSSKKSILKYRSGEVKMSVIHQPGPEHRQDITVGQMLEMFSEERCERILRLISEKEGAVTDGSFRIDNLYFRLILEVELV